MCRFLKTKTDTFVNPCACVKKKPAVGQPLNLQTLPLCLLLLLLLLVAAAVVVVLISRAEARLRRAMSGSPLTL
jgi:hypothetical protein